MATARINMASTMTAVSHHTRSPRRSASPMIQSTSPTEASPSPSLTRSWTNNVFSIQRTSIPHRIVMGSTASSKPPRNRTTRMVMRESIKTNRPPGFSQLIRWPTSSSEGLLRMNQSRSRSSTSMRFFLSNHQSQSTSSGQKLPSASQGKTNGPATRIWAAICWFWIQWLSAQDSQEL